MSLNTINHFNVKFVSMLLMRILEAINLKKLELSQQDISKYGIHDDFMYSEYLTDEFADLLPEERLAIMKIVRTLINASVEAYGHLLDENYLQYENFGSNDEGETNTEIENFIESLKAIE